MHVRSLLPLVLVACLLFLGSLFITSLQSASAEGAFQTWPSRTPTPGNEATKPPGGPTPGGSEPPTATAESTPFVSQTATPIPELSSPSSTVSSPGVTTEAQAEGPTEEGQVPEESGGCEVPPSVQAAGRIEVREAPEVDAPVIGFLETAEMRVIIGRSEFSPWWFIQFAADLQGWVPDTEIAVRGYTGYVPIILTTEETTSAEVAWEPTPNPQCTPAPVATVVSDTERVNGDQDGNQEEDATGERETASSRISAELVSEATPTSDQTTTNSDSMENGPDQPSYLWLLITGAFLIIAGALSLLLRRKQS